MMPHVGASVGFPSEELLQTIARGCSDSNEDPGAEIGHLSIGSIVMDGGKSTRGRSMPVHFRMDSLIGRRTAVFARAGMGKSNFVKVLLTRLYEKEAANRPGAIIIDPEGEYAFRNASEPGLLDVPALRERIVVFTDRSDFAPDYSSHIKGNCSINLAHVDPIDVVNTLLPPEKQELVFANIIRSLERPQWSKLIALLAKHGYRTKHEDIAKIVGKQQRGNKQGESYDVVLGAIINNLVPAINRLHSATSNIVPATLKAVAEGRIVLFDFSMLTSGDARLIAAWIMNAIFANNQQAFTSHRDPETPLRPRLLPALAVLEEAQFYLGDSNLREDSPFVRWFKEGRKFQLGSIIITQQPGAIGPELISQCDNFFVFHLLSRIDLDALAKANLHYAGDIATAIGHEPIPGNCFLWSSRGLSFVTTARIRHFAELAGGAAPAIVGSQFEETAVAPPAPEVMLPIHDMSIEQKNIERLLARFLRKIIEEDRIVHLFSVTRYHLDGDSAKAMPPPYELLAVKEDYVRRQLGKRIHDYIIEKPAFADQLSVLLDAGSAALTPHVEKAFEDSEFIPMRYIVEDVKMGNRWYLLLKSKLDLRQKPDVKGTLEVKVI
jgi:hypothetical protein